MSQGPLRRGLFSGLFALLFGWCLEKSARAMPPAMPIPPLPPPVFDPPPRCAGYCPGSRTTFVYDSTGRLVATTNPLGSRTTFAYDATKPRL